jgi:hypothetical protein
MWRVVSEGKLGVYEGLGDGALGGGGLGVDVCVGGELARWMEGGGTWMKMRRRKGREGLEETYKGGSHGR